MGQIKIYLRDTYELSNYQIAQIAFLFKTIFSEVSKILIMGFLFHGKLPLYIFALFVMIVLRSLMGGLHFYTYLKCLLASTLYLGLSIYVLPNISIALYLQVILLLLSVLICNSIGPITSIYRPEACKRHFTQYKRLVTAFILLYTLVLCVMPENNPYLCVGFWVITLHSLQLIIAKIQTKGGEPVR
ncbi:MAG: hypothetical protein HDR16_11225 [Lachnospiraceae bacterium]|nr:hypothetical protein [Lachnospiraceae bacterium]